MSNLDVAARPVPLAVMERAAATETPNREDALPVRFVEGIRRSTGAVAGCLIVRDRHAHDGEPQICGRTAVATDADAALATLAATAPLFGYHDHVWLHRPEVVAHAGLLIETPMRDAAGQLLLVFASADLDAPGAVGRIMALVPGMAAAAGAMQDMWLDLERTREVNHSLASVLHQSECGTILVHADHGVMFSNLPAQAILADRDGIELRHGKLRPTRYQDAIRFQAALDHVLTLPPAQNEPGRHSMMLLLDRPGAERPLIAVIAPRAAETAADGSAATVYVMRPELSQLRGVEAICQLHGLSPVETQLVARLVAGTTLGEAAAEMRIKPDTARAYLKQVFAKTDTHRQADLIQLIVRYQRAVRGEFVFHAG